MHTIGRLPRWLIEKDPSWERTSGTGYGLHEWIKRGSALRAHCITNEWYCDITTADRREGFDLSESTPNLDTSIFTSAEFDLRKYLSSRYLNPGIDTNKLGMIKSRKLW
jgi:hypothetical protein